MQKELYKLILVFIMISFSFALAFFIGREITLAGQKNQAKKKFSGLYKIEKPANKTVVSSSLKQGISLKQTEELKNTNELASPKQDLQKPFTKKKEVNLKSSPLKKTIQKATYIHALFIAKFLKKDQAMSYATKIKLSFPNWRIFVKRASRIEYAVYVGPFQKKETAKTFLNEIEDKKQFPSIRLETIVIRKSKKKSSE